MNSARFFGEHKAIGFCAADGRGREFAGNARFLGGEHLGRSDELADFHWVGGFGDLAPA